jgi:hypothetical protein
VVTAHVLGQIRCSEVSIWHFTGPVGQRRLVCVAANDQVGGWHERPYDDLLESQFAASSVPTTPGPTRAWPASATPSLHVTCAPCST